MGMNSRTRKPGMGASGVLIRALGTAVPGFLVGAGISESADPKWWFKDAAGNSDPSAAIAAGGAAAAGGLLTHFIMNAVERRRSGGKDQ